MPIVTINGTEVEVDKGTTILRAAAVAGFEVPHFCYHPSLSAPANCRMCLVEVEGGRKLMPACYNTVNDGMIVHTESEQVIRARKAVLEFILVNHPVDCPICDKAGECKLQDYYFAYDAQDSRMRAEKQHKVKAYPIGPNVVYDGERCILCTRCIRFCEEISKTGELTLAERGDKIEVRTFPDRDLDNAYSMCTVDVCPVGALTSRDFRFKCRVWLLTSTESVCVGCEAGCNIHLDHFRNEVQRYRPRYNPEVNEYWMCDEGRLSYKRLHRDRLLLPMSNGAADNWHRIAGTVADKLGAAISTHGANRIGFVLSPQASCEALFLAKAFVDGVVGEEAKLYLGGFAPGASDDFLIRADKNPNTKGVEAVFGQVRSFEQLVAALRKDEIKVLYMMGSKTPCVDEVYLDFVSSLDSLDLFVLQAAHQSDLLEKAHIALPACTHAEDEGTFINGDGHVQGFMQAFEPHGDSMPDWQIFMRLARAMGKPLPFTFLSSIQDKMFASLKLGACASDAKSAAHTGVGDLDADVANVLSSEEEDGASV